MPSPLDVLGVLSSPTGAHGGGATLPNTSQTSSAHSSLDSSGSSYNLTSGTPGDLIVGGSKSSPWIILGAVAILAFFGLRHR